METKTRKARVNVQLQPNIPCAFKLAGCYWKVVETEGFYDQGMCYPEEHTIRIRKELSYISSMRVRCLDHNRRVDVKEQ